MVVLRSLEELLADEEEFDSQGRTLSEIARPTQAAYDKIGREWQTYTERINKPDLIPNKSRMKGFFKTLAIERRGYLEDKLTVLTLTHYATQLAAVTQRKWDVKISAVDTQEVKNYIRTILKKSFNLSTKARSKPVVGSHDLDNILLFLWTQDQHTFRHRLDRVKLAFYLLILAFTAARPGAVILSDAYRHDDCVLKYKDLKLHLVTEENEHEPRLSLTITFNNMKGDRDKDCDFLIMTLWEDRLFPHLCPIMLFLTLAFAHGALDLEPEDLFAPTTEPGVLEVRFNEAVLDTPVFRASNGSVDEWTYAGMAAALSSLVFRAGYNCSVTSYAVRRGAANVLERSATWAERGLIMGHKNPRILQAKYANKHVGFQLQGAFHDKDHVQTDRSRLLRTVVTNHFPGAPFDLRGKAVHQELRQAPSFLKLYDEWQALKINGASTQAVDSARAKQKYELACLRRKATKEVRSEWIKSQSSRVVGQQQKQGELAEKPDNEHHGLPPWRVSLARLLYEPKDQSQKERLELLYSLRSKDDQGFSCPFILCSRHNKPLSNKRCFDQHIKMRHSTLQCPPPKSCPKSSSKSPQVPTTQRSEQSAEYISEDQELQVDYQGAPLALLRKKWSVYESDHLVIQVLENDLKNNRILYWDEIVDAFNRIEGVSQRSKSALQLRWRKILLSNEDNEDLEEIAEDFKRKRETRRLKRKGEEVKDDRPAKRRDGPF